MTSVVGTIPVEFARRTDGLLKVLERLEILVEEIGGNFEGEK